MSNKDDLYVVAHQFNPDALRLARELRGLQKIELATELDISPSSVTQFESGAIKPTPNTVARMSLKLGFPASFFALKEVNTITSAECHFRKQHSSSQAERKQMVGVSFIIGRLIDFFESFIDLPEEQVTRYMKTNLASREEIELAAMQLRKEWGLGNGPIHDLIVLLESKGIMVIRLMSECARVDAFSLYYKHRPIIFLNTCKESTSRTRFDAAHELGHLIMHTDCKLNDDDQERQADAFASAFLLPRDGFLPECPTRLVWEHFIAVKKRWRVSVRALVRRARDLGAISEPTYKRAQVQIAKMGWSKGEPAEPPVEFPIAFKKSVGVLAEIGWSLDKIAESLCIHEGDLKHWIFADDQNQIEDSSGGDLRPNLSLLRQQNQN